MERVFVLIVSPRSTMTNRESKLEEGGRSVIRSQETYWKGQEAEDLIVVRGVWWGVCLTYFAGRWYSLQCIFRSRRQGQATRIQQQLVDRF